MTLANSAIALGPGPIIALVVDDEPDLQDLIEQRFRRHIRSGNYIFHFARDGEEALEVLEQSPEIEVVVTDINMPRMDGLALLEALAARDSTLRSVVISAYGDMDNIRTAMNRGAYDFLTKPVDFRDFEHTLEKTARHVRSLRYIQRERAASSILRQFVDDAVVRYAQQNATEPGSGSGKLVDRTVVFIDVCSFTSLAERNEPLVVLQLLNSYFDAIASRIVAHGGTIDKFIGDAVMAVFQGVGAQCRATLAAVEARYAIRQMRGQVESQVGFFPNISAGIHAGLLIEGPVGAGVVGRLDFTVIGDVVNTAARLQDVAGPGEIVVSQRVREQLRPGDLPPEVVIEERGVHSIRGKAEPLMLYSIRTPRDVPSAVTEIPD